MKRIRTRWLEEWDGVALIVSDKRINPLKS